MTRRAPLARLMTLAFHLNIATALALVLWTAWTGYLVGTGQLRPAPQHDTPDCRCHREGLVVHAAPAAEAA
ncbi:hypothetical protein DBR42_23325 [Pelomonas sp. HMWF004]|nr:hypothetical protein DBR42_23325 [Pelomonas sp. HMWF004]